MGLTLEWIDNNPLVSLDGDIVFDDLYHSDGRIYGDSRFDSTQYIIYDLSEVNSLTVTNADIEAISTLDKSASRWNAEIKLAIVTGDEHIKKVALAYSAFMKESSWKIRVFKTLNEALDWCKK